MLNTIDSPSTPQSSGTPSKLYFTVDLVDDNDMGSKSRWPNFPYDYLESRRESIHDQICQNDMDVSDVHRWLLNRGRWISKKHLEDALRAWIDDDPLNWPDDIPDLELCTSRQDYAIDDLLEECGNPYINEIESDFDAQRGYGDPRGDPKSRKDKSKANYTEVKEYENRGRQFDRRDKYDTRSFDVDQIVERSRRKVSGATSAVPEAKPIVQRMSRPGLGQTMSSRYVPGLEIQIPRSTPDATSNRRTLDFFGSLLPPDSPWAKSPSKVPRDRSRSFQLDLPKAYPMNENSGPRSARPYVNGGGNGSAYDWRRDEGFAVVTRDKNLPNPAELARQEKEDNDCDWKFFMTAVKHSS